MNQKINNFLVKNHNGKIMKIKLYIFLRSTFSWYILILALCLYSCNGNTLTQSNKPLTFNKIQHLAELADTTQSYELYLPMWFNNKKEYPVIFMFDPHGSGILAVENGKEAAERYGYILVGSNNSKNGIQNLTAITEALFNDVLKRYPVDESRIYVAGFSGGGRVASSLALSSGNVRGIITCSAGLPGFDPFTAPRKFEIYATAGKHDFNYYEVAAISKQLDQTDWRYLVTSFDGGHTWPPVSFINEAVAWFNINAMRNKLIPTDKQFLRQIHDHILMKTEQYLTSGQFISAANGCSNGIAELDGLYNIKMLWKKLESIQTMEEYGLEKQKAEKVKFTEMKLRDAYMQNLTSQGVTWWTNEITSLKDRITHEKDSLNRQMYSRVKGFLGIVCYSYTARAINSGDYLTAEKCLEVYQLAEPKNPDCYFFKSLLFDKQNRVKEASESLSIALKLGFYDSSKMKELSAKTVKAAKIINQ